MSWRWNEEDQSFLNDQGQKVTLREVTARYGPGVDLSADLLTSALNQILKTKLEIEEEDHGKDSGDDERPTGGS